MSFGLVFCSQIRQVIHSNFTWNVFQISYSCLFICEQHKKSFFSFDTSIICLSEKYANYATKTLSVWSKYFMFWLFSKWIIRNKTMLFSNFVHFDHKKTLRFTQADSEQCSVFCNLKLRKDFMTNWILFFKWKYETVHSFFVFCQLSGNKGCERVHEIASFW